MVQMKQKLNSTLIRSEKTPLIIDFVNYTLYHPGAEASILFHLHEYGLRVPRFFCIPEQYEPEELDAYFAMHFQDVLQYHVWMTATHCRF